METGPDVSEIGVFLSSPSGAPDSSRSWRSRLSEAMAFKLGSLCSAVLLFAVAHSALEYCPKQVDSIREAQPVPLVFGPTELKPPDEVERKEIALWGGAFPVPAVIGLCPYCHWPVVFARLKRFGAARLLALYDSVGRERPGTGGLRLHGWQIAQRLRDASDRGGHDEWSRWYRGVTAWDYISTLTMLAGVPMWLRWFVSTVDHRERNGEYPGNHDPWRHLYNLRKLLGLTFQLSLWAFVPGMFSGLPVR